MGAAGRVKGEHVIVDGYNVLFSHPGYAAQAREDLEAGRARLVADLAGYAEGGPSTIVVFDGANNPLSDGSPHRIGCLTVIFSPAGVSADTTIEALARRYRERGERALVVTSDNATRDTVAAGTVAVISSDQFATELGTEIATRLEDARPGRRMPVASRIDPRVSERLAQWARGRTSHKD